MTTREDLDREIMWLAGVIVGGSEEVATGCYPENMQAVADMARREGYDIQFGETINGQVMVSFFPRGRGPRPPVPARPKPVPQGA